MKKYFFCFLLIFIFSVNTSFANVNVSVDFNKQLASMYDVLSSLMKTANAQSVPIITRISPSSGTAPDTSGNVSVIGSGFTNTSRILFGNSNGSIYITKTLTFNGNELFFDIPGQIDNCPLSNYCSGVPQKISVSPGRYYVSVLNSSGESNRVTYDVVSQTTGGQTEFCAQVITYAKNNTTGECKQYPDSCIPSGWTTVSSCQQSCKKAGESLGAVYGGNTAKCCAGLVEVPIDYNLPPEQRRIGARGTCMNSYPSDMWQEENIICAQVITYAKNDTISSPSYGECREFSNSCIPKGWTAVDSCPIVVSCKKAGESLGAVYGGNTAKCCAGLVEVPIDYNLPPEQRRIGARGTCMNSYPSDMWQEENIICAQVITYAKNDTISSPSYGECREFSNSCIPKGWTAIDSCPSTPFKILFPVSGSKLQIGKTYGLSWRGMNDGVNSYSIYLVGGSLNSALYLGEAYQPTGIFYWNIPSTVKPGGGYQIQFSGKYATGDNSESFSIIDSSDKAPTEQTLFLSFSADNPTSDGFVNIKWSSDGVVKCTMTEDNNVASQSAKTLNGNIYVDMSGAKEKKYVMTCYNSLGFSVSKTLNLKPLGLQKSVQTSSQQSICKQRGEKYFILYGEKCCPGLSSESIGEGMYRCVDSNMGQKTAPSDIKNKCTSLGVDLRYKYSDADTKGEVSDLQNFLVNFGYLKTEPTGYFGPMTVKAVASFQKDYGINQTGGVGPLTRNKIKSISCNMGQKTAPSDIKNKCTSLGVDLRYKYSDADTKGEVSDLQNFLVNFGYLKTEPTGYFGPMTVKAVASFQKDYGINQTGGVGPLTRNKIKSISCNN